MKSSNFLTLNAKDFVKGLIMAVIGAVWGIVEPLINSGSIAFDWANIGKYALIAAIGYLFKNFLTNSNDQFAKKEV